MTIQDVAFIANEYSGPISFRMDWLDLLAGTLKSLLQHHSSKASILQCSAFFIVQFSHPNMTTGKPIALTRWTFVGKVMSLLFNTLSRLVITFLPRCNVGDLGSIPGLGRSPGKGQGYPLQYSGLENSMDGIVHGDTKSWTWLSDFHFHFFPGRGRFRAEGHGVV